MFKTTFLFKDEAGNSQVIEGVVKIKRIVRGDCFYDITQIKNITNGNIGQSIINHAAESACDVSNITVPQKEQSVNSNSMQNSESYSIPEEPYSEYDKQITMDDVYDLRSIITSHNGERVSINDFTGEDIKKSQKWVHKFYKELGTKSPFFRAWFGDWRAEQKDKHVSILSAINVDGKNPRGEYRNNDTGWNIVSFSVGYDETISHSGKDKLSLLAMRNIDKIIENAILLDTIKNFIMLDQ